LLSNLPCFHAGNTSCFCPSRPVCLGFLLNTDTIGRRAATASPDLRNATVSPDAVTCYKESFRAAPAIQHGCHPCVAVYMLLALANAALLPLCYDAVTVDAALRANAAPCRCCRCRHHRHHSSNQIIVIIYLFLLSASLYSLDMSPSTLFLDALLQLLLLFHRLWFLD